IISGKKKQAQLVMITTTSALGKSSIYNRVKLGGQTYLQSIGYTQGWGHFHVPHSLFLELRSYLRERKHHYVDGHRFGDGPNWRLRTIRAAGFQSRSAQARHRARGVRVSPCYERRESSARRT